MVEECLCCTIISHKVFTAPDRPQWFWAWWVDSSTRSLASEACSLHVSKHAGVHGNTHARELRHPVMGWKSEEGGEKKKKKKKADEHRHNSLPTPA